MKLSSFHRHHSLYRFASWILKPNHLIRVFISCKWAGSNDYRLTVSFNKSSSSRNCSMTLVRVTIKQNIRVYIFIKCGQVALYSCLYRRQNNQLRKFVYSKYTWIEHVTWWSHSFWMRQTENHQNETEWNTFLREVSRYFVTLTIFDSILSTSK